MITKRRKDEVSVELSFLLRESSGIHASRTSTLSVWQGWRGSCINTGVHTIFKLIRELTMMRNKARERKLPKIGFSYFQEAFLLIIALIRCTGSIECSLRLFIAEGMPQSILLSSPRARAEVGGPVVGTDPSRSMEIRGANLNCSPQ